MTRTESVDAFLVADDDGVVVDANPEACDLFGRPRDRIIGLRIAPHSPPEILAELGYRWAELRSRGCVSGSADIAHSDGSRRALGFVAQTDLPIPGWTLVRLRPAASVDGA